MEFKRFAEFLKEREVSESAEPDTTGYNRDAMTFDTKRQAVLNRFGGDVKKALEVIQGAGYKDIRDFVSAPEKGKWERLRIPGQKNYVGS